MTVEYFLMNKDRKILRFQCAEDNFGETQAVELEWYSDVRPLGYCSLLSFLETRRAPKHRKHIEALLEKYGCSRLEGFLQVTHALSLNDTFWVRQADEDLKWNDVSLYSNPFDDLVAAAAFDGRFSSTSFSTTSPEFSTDGRFAKCWVRDGDDIWLYKTGSETFELEPLCEYLASQFRPLP